jgi:transposase-like protein
VARANYDDNVKAAAMAALLTGQGVDKVAEEYQIPPSTLRGWKSKAKAQGHVPPQKKEAVGDLLVSYLETNLRTLKAQSEFFSDREWLKEQNAQELAVLHGVITDKTVRLLEALGPSPNGAG